MKTMGAFVFRWITKFSMMVLVCSTVFTPFAYGQSAELEKAVERAFTYTDVQRFEEALIILNQVSVEDKQHLLYGLTKARILTWSRNYPAAQIEFSKLLEKHSENPDVLVPYAYLQLFDGNLVTAEHYFSQVLLKYPDYQDAQEGLFRTQRLRRERRSILESGYQVVEKLTR